MYVINEYDFPIKIWGEKMNEDSGCMEQAKNLSRLPFAHKWVALMPDNHKGKGMPIGGVIACEGAVIPNAVGVDIGCGMGFVQTNIPVKALRETDMGSGSLLQMIIGDILRNIPTGFSRHGKAQESVVLDRAKNEMDKYENNPELIKIISEGYFQVGTLGGGNHFIELQEDDEGMCGIMLHSGSRNFGFNIGNYFNQKAAELNEKWHTAVAPEWRLSFLPVDSDEGRQYLDWMRLAMDFAYENRAAMLKNVKEIFAAKVEKYTEMTAEFSGEINCHHNYASLENHYGKDVWVHRKGAVSAREGEMGIIPGSMGSYSYITKGLGNPESFMSSSHGAGRLYSRTAAVKEFPVEKVIVDLKERGVILGKHKKSDVAEESRFAYKDIDSVMENQRDLTEAVKRLFTVGVVKG
ncbi:MAG: RtcB family protein [Oscillospiraceae bacterium]|nr:RtcB family protein [Oscillospiraceae bacterium]